MDQKDFLQRRTDALANELGAMSLLRAAAEARDRRAVLRALDLLGVWLTRTLTDKECWALRSAAHDIGVDLPAFDQHCVTIEKETSHV